MRIRNRDSRDLAKELAEKYRLHKAEQYDLVERAYDGLYELVAKLPDPHYQADDFDKRGLMFPLKWCTVAVLDPRTLKVV